ncbi:MAG: LytTR family transcriptional regulator DNA-binding domain-containing protein [Lachnospiraceae bacterium]|nr:LytTR family transcriptional regulator DNA-binding domain-containing protein [Lachnospiraceae bacterium]
MKVILEKVPTENEECALIKAAEVTEEIRNAMDLLENNCRSISVAEVSEDRTPGETVMLGTDLIYYTESIDKKTFVYTKYKCYGTKLRLYELEGSLSSNFFRCSKSLIVNIRKIRSVRSEFNGRMIAELLNGEQLVINRSYVKDLKRKLGV